MPKNSPKPQFLRVVFSPGVNPDKWLRRFDERVPGWRAAAAATDQPMPFLKRGTADVGIVRLGPAGVPPEYHCVELYAEQLGVAAPKEHPIEVMRSVRLSELADEVEMYRTPTSGIDDIPALKEALSVVAANVGIAIAPKPLLRALRPRSVVHRDLFQDATPPIPETRIALVWLKDRDADEVQDFVGICRGRKAGSSRGRVVCKGEKQKRR